MTDIDALTQRVANHLAGRPVIIRWRNPPSESAVGQVVKTCDGDLIIYVGNLTSVRSRFQVLIHELAHCRLDADFVPVSNDHKTPSSSITRSDTERQSWRQHPREKRAQRQAAEWISYAERNEYKYWHLGNTPIECQLLALLNME